MAEATHSIALGNGVILSVYLYSWTADSISFQVPGETPKGEFSLFISIAPGTGFTIPVRIPKYWIPSEGYVIPGTLQVQVPLAAYVDILASRYPVRVVGRANPNARGGELWQWWELAVPPGHEIKLAKLLAEDPLVKWVEVSAGGIGSPD